MGPFPKDEQGLVQKEALVQLKRVMSKHAYLNFLPFKDQMMKDRFADLQAGNESSYRQKVIQASQKAAEIQSEVMQLACSNAGISDADFSMSMGAAVSDPSFM